MAPSDEDLDALTVYEINRPLFWDPTSKLYAENETSVQQGVGIRNRQQIVMGRKDEREGENRHTNLSSILEESTYNILNIAVIC